MSRKFAISIVLMVFASIFMSTLAVAEERPIQLALVAPLQIFPEEESIAGIRLNLIYGRNVAVTGLDIGFVNHCTGDVSKGYQPGFLNLVEADFVGWQKGFVNLTRGDFEGLQWGFMNYAAYANGLQLGIVNYAERLHGLQIGFVNIIQQGGQFPVFPIVNWSF